MEGETYVLIRESDLLFIARFADQIEENFPVRKIAELARSYEELKAVMQRVQPSGSEGIIHARLDQMYEKSMQIFDRLDKLEGRARVAEQIVGPPVKVTMPRFNVPPRPQQGGVFEHDLNERPDFDSEIGG